MRRCWPPSRPGWPRTASASAPTPTRCSPKNLPWRQRAIEFNRDFPQFHDLLVAVIDARTPRRRTPPRPRWPPRLSADHAHFISVRRPDASPYLQQGGAAVPRHEAAVRPDGPHDRRAAVPGPARRRSHGARPVLRPGIARHGGDAGRRRPDALSDADARASTRRLPTRSPAIRSRCRGRPCSAATCRTWPANTASCWCSRGRITARCSPAAPPPRRCAPPSPSSPFVQGGHGARAHHRPGRAGRRGVRLRRPGRRGRPDRQRGADHAVAVPGRAHLAADRADPAARWCSGCR